MGKQVLLFPYTKKYARVHLELREQSVLRDSFSAPILSEGVYTRRSRVPEPVEKKRGNLPLFCDMQNNPM